MRISIIGATGGIGGGFLENFAAQEKVDKIIAFSRSEAKFDNSKIVWHHINLDNEDSIARAAKIAHEQNALDVVIVATGMLHDKEFGPEKSLKELSSDKFHRILDINLIGPSLVAKHFLSNFSRDRKQIFAALSARVGSISDNFIGGWYAYRASKAALNMVIKNAAIEVGRKNKQAIIVGLHPGTVDSSLSKPFQKNLPAEQLFSPKESTLKMIHVLESLSAEDSGKCFAYDGMEIEP